MFTECHGIEQVDADLAHSALVEIRLWALIRDASKGENTIFHRCPNNKVFLFFLESNSNE